MRVSRSRAVAGVEMPRPDAGGVLLCGGQRPVWTRPREKAPREAATRENATTPPRAERVAATPVRVMFINMVTSFQTSGANSDESVSDAKSDASARSPTASSRFTEFERGRALPDGRDASARVA